MSAPGQQTRASLAATMAAWAVLSALVVGYAVLFGWLSLQGYWSYEMHALDMGNMGQAAWNTIHGHPFAFTNMRLPYAIEAWRTTTRLSFHVEALFPVISLVYLIYPHPESLLALQTLALAAGAIPVYLLARDVLGRRVLGLVFALLYLLFPTLEAMNLYEFHPVALATPLLLFAFWFAWHRRYVPFVLCCLAAMGTKEQIGLTVAMFGLYVALVNRDWAVGLGTAAVGVVWSLFAALIIERHFRQPGTVTYLRSRYGYLGHGIQGAIHTVMHNPGVFFPVVFTWQKLYYLRFLLAPVGFVALFAPYVLLLGAPTLLLNLLSKTPQMYSGLGDNSAELVSVVIIAGILGARVVLRELEDSMPEPIAGATLAGLILAVALWNQHVNGYTPLGVLYQSPKVGYHQRLANHFVAEIPDGVPVSTQDQLDPHLSSRRYLYLFPDLGQGLDPTNYLLLDAAAPTYPLPSYQIHDLAEQQIHKVGWGIAAADDGLILIKRGAHRKMPPAAFYRYLLAGPARVQHRLDVDIGPLTIVGYSVQRTDLANHRIPNLAYTIFLRLRHHAAQNVQPVLWELVNAKTMIGCAHEPLGLAWLPTARWRPGRTYAVSMDQLETNWPTPTTARLYLDIEPVPPSVPAHPDCSHLWPYHTQLFQAGTLDIQY